MRKALKMKTGYHNIACFCPIVCLIFMQKIPSTFFSFCDKINIPKEAGSRQKRFSLL